MKHLELQLQKRLLIVESEDDKIISYFLWNDGEMHQRIKFICKGSELTEEIADEYVEIFDLGFFVDYNGHSPRCYVLTALESFISAIEANGYYWGENPEGEEPMIDDFTYIFHQNNGAETINWDHYDFATKQWQESESKTFNPEKTLIFEIL